jgi:DNA-binding response OmpR family regulator
MKRRILLVDDEVAVLLTMKAVLEISGFEVDTAASAREGKSKLHTREYHMIITDMRMESDAAGAEVIEAARSASYHPAVALLTAFPVADEDWQEMGADKLLVKPVHTRILLEQIESLLVSHEAKLAKLGSRTGAKAATAKTPAKSAAKKAAAKKTAPRKAVILKKPAAKPVAKAPVAKKPAAKKSVNVKKTVAKKTGAKSSSKK